MLPVLLSDTVHTDSFTAYNNNNTNNNNTNNNNNNNNDNNKLKVLKQTNSGRVAENKAADLLIPSRCGTLRAQETHKSSSNEFRILYE